MRFNSAAISLLIAAGFFVFPQPVKAAPLHSIEQAVAVGQEHNPDILIARKRAQGARGSWIEARAGFLPSVSSSGLYDKRQTRSETTLRQEDYNAILKLEQNVYTGGGRNKQGGIPQAKIGNAKFELAG